MTTDEIGRFGTLETTERADLPVTNVGGALDVTDGATVGGSLTVGNAASVGDSLDVTNGATVGGTLDVNGSGITLGGHLIDDQGGRIEISPDAGTFRVNDSNGNATLYLFDSGNMDLRYGRLQIQDPQTGSVGSSSNPALHIGGGGAGLYLSSGNLMAVDENGNTTTIV